MRTNPEAAALAVFDADELAGAVDIGNFQRDGFGDAESGSVAGLQHGAMLDAGDRVEEALDFARSQHDGHLSFPRASPAWSGRGLYGGNERVDALRGEFTHLRQIELVLADGSRSSSSGLRWKCLANPAT
jgi:hypothetical protein